MAAVEEQTDAASKGGGLSVFFGWLGSRLAALYTVGESPADEKGWAASEFSRVWGRVIILFLGLAAVKFLMLARLGGHMFQIHWRVPGRAAGWFEYSCFFLVGAAGVFGMVRLARVCRDLPVSAARAANAWLVVLGLTGIFLSFHEGEWNWLLPVMEGTLDVGDLWSYMSMNLFFRSPYLGVWIAVYAAIAFGLVRTGRERGLLYVTAAFFAVYYLVFLNDLVRRGDDLLLLACLGVCAMLGRGDASSRARMFVWTVAGVSLLAVAAWFQRHGDRYETTPGYASLLVSDGAVLFGVSIWYAARFGYLAVWSRFVFFFFVSFLLLSSHHYPQAGNFNNLALFALTLPRYLAQEALLVAALAAALCFVSRRRPGRSMIWFDVLAFLTLLTAVVDYKILATMGVRLDWNVIAMSNSLKMIWRMALPYLPAASVALALGFGGYALAVWQVCGRRSKLVETALRQRRSVWLPLALPLVVLTLVGLARVNGDKARGIGLFAVAATSPVAKALLNERYDREEFETLARELKLFPGRGAGRRREEAKAEGERPLNVFLIIMESSYNRHLSLFGCDDETQPLLSAYKERMELFPNFYCNFPTSNHARFSVLTGLLSPKDYVSYTNPRIETPSLFEIFHARGHATAVYDSCFLDYVRFRDFLAHRDVDALHDCDTMPGRENFRKVSWGLEEECTRDAIVRQFEAYARSGEPFVLSYLPVAPHYPYDTVEKRFQKFSYMDDALLRGDYTGRYKNELLYLDWVIASMIDALRDFGLLDDTLVVITNDHGEMLGENKGIIGHGWNLDPGLANIPLIVMDPRRPGYRVNQTLGSQIDVLPTILDLAGIPIPEGALLQGVSLYDEEANRDKVVRLNSHRQRGLIRGDRYIVESADDSKVVEVYRISHEGTKTLFERVEEKAEIGEEMDRYERFQDSFILNHAYYRELMRQPGG